jgi:DNA-binding IclR family transcriptional regulator
VPREAQKQVGMFRADTTRRVAKLVSEQPGIAQSQLCQTLGLSASAASKQLSRLEAASLVRREPEAGTLRLYPGVALAGAV